MERRAIAIQGTVQGVGFRPFVYLLATRLQLGGFVQNRMGGVCIEVEGEPGLLDQFLAELINRPPELAAIEDWSCARQSPVGDLSFRIEHSDEAPGGAVVVAPDSATCADCLAELFDPADRRYRYPFLNCTNCGPRLTIITGSPYDRAQTTMARFEMCRQCRAEYDNSLDRRFHAQPTACANCGPVLRLLDGNGKPIETDDPLGAFEAALRGGKIGAMKGLGGYHLVVDARNPAAVTELRRRKHRDEKPFAIMVGDVASAERLCHVSPGERALLTSRARPIVLLQTRWSADLAPGVAPRNPLLGVMLPYTPLHHLLLRDMGAVPLVMTSGNRSDEPIAYQEADAVERLRGIADLFLTHDRPIHVRCDDSVIRIVEGKPAPLRRSRGYAPGPIVLPVCCAAPILAVGGQLKAAFALGSGRRAILSHHLGDLDHLRAYNAFETDVALYERLFSLRPGVLAHDLHPDYASSRYALRRASLDGIKCIAVQHHHAHMASCMAEHQLSGPVIGVTFDGTGFGTDGTIWGGEFLVGDYRSFRRAAHLRYVGLPGGDQAVREPWRVAVAHLLDAAACCDAHERRMRVEPLRIVRAMFKRKFNTPPTSSAGRLFDAVASLIGVRDTANYEGQAAIELEWLAAGASAGPVYPFALPGADAPLDDANPLVVDTRPMIGAIAGDVDAGVAPATIARKFHSTLAEMIASVCGLIRESAHLNTVVLSGGAFMNALLTVDTEHRLAANGFFVFRHEAVPCNDGGISLGQLAIAAAQSI